MSFKPIPLSRPDLTESDIQAVVDVLRTPYLSLGPKLVEFERTVSELIGVREAVAVNSGTSALHLMIRGLGIGEGDEVITSPFSFVSSSNVMLFERGVPVFVDIDPETLNIDANRIEEKALMNTSKIRLLCVAATLVFCGSALAQFTTSSFGARVTTLGNTIAYENQNEDLGGFFQSIFITEDPITGTTLTTTEFGDEITLKAGASKTIRKFDLEYYTNFQPQDDVHSAVIRFYDMAGKDDPGPVGEALFMSNPFSLDPGLGVNGGFGVISITDFSGAFPSEFITYTIEFSGIDAGGGEIAGLSWYGTPNVGTSANYIWQRTAAGDWRKVVIIPEPTIFQLSLMAGLGWLGYFGWRRGRKGS